MGSSNLEATRCTYRNHVYQMSVTKDNDIYVEIFKMGTERALNWATFRTFFTKRRAEKAVRNGHAWARNCIDERMVVLTAIVDVLPSSCRGLKQS